MKEICSHMVCDVMQDGGLLTFFTLCQHKMYGRVLRAAVQFDHVSLIFFNILWCTDAWTLTSVSIQWKISHSVGIFYF